jgi:phosphoribosylglycinamide formyltransferase-1
MQQPRLIIFASGTKDGGGSGFENLVEATRLRQGSGKASEKPTLDADIVAVVSNHEHGGVRACAERLGIPFVYFPGPYDAEHYQAILADTGAEWVALSGWLRHVAGTDPRKTFNIHPALLSFDNGRFGGKGMYGHAVHEAVKKALDAGEITESGFTMHFVTEEHDRGPAFFEHHVPLEKGMSTDDIAKAVNQAEHEWQPKLTNAVVQGEIRWDGKDPNSLIVPNL